MDEEIGALRAHRMLARLSAVAVLGALALTASGCVLEDDEPDRVSVFEVGKARVKDDPFTGKVADTLRATARGPTAHFQGQVAGRPINLDATPVALGSREQADGVRMLTVRMRLTNEGDASVRVSPLPIRLDVQTSSEDPEKRDDGIGVETLDCDGVSRAAATIPAGRSATQCANYIIWKDRDPVRMRYQPPGVETTATWSVHAQ